MIDADLLLADLRDDNDSQRMKTRLEWRRRIEAAGGRLAEEVERKREESIPSMRALLRGERSSLSRNDPMPVLFVAGLAVITLLELWGFISLARFLWEIGGGK